MTDIARRSLAGLITFVAFCATPDALLAQGPPDPPINIVATPAATSVHLSWDRDPSSTRRTAVAFRVYRDGSALGTTVSESYTDTGLAVGREYAYRVSGIDILGREGSLSAPVLVRTIDDSAPSPPGDLVAEAKSSSRIDLEWEAASDEESEIEIYYVYRDGGPVPIDSTADLSYSDTGLQAFTGYEYVVTAINVSGIEGPPSNEAAAMTFDGTPPSAPNDLLAESGSTTRVDVSWSPATDPETGIDGYYIYRDGSDVPSDSTVGTSYADEGLEAGSEHTYEVAAINGEGLVGPRAGPVTGRVFDGTPPTAPADLVAEAGAAGVSLSWTAASDPESGVRVYLLYRSPRLVAFDSTTATSFLDSTVEPDTEYAYRVSARNHDGLEGPQSNVAEVLTPPEPPEPPEPPDTTPPAAPTGLRVVSE